VCPCPAWIKKLPIRTYAELLTTNWHVLCSIKLGDSPKAKPISLCCNHELLSRSILWVACRKRGCLDLSVYWGEAYSQGDDGYRISRPGATWSAVLWTLKLSSIFTRNSLDSLVSYFYVAFYKNVTSTKCIYIFSYFNAKFQDLTMNGATVVSHSEFLKTTRLMLLMVGN